MLDEHVSSNALSLRVTIEAAMSRATLANE